MSEYQEELIKELSEVIYDLGAHPFMKIPGTRTCAGCKRSSIHPLHDIPSQVAKRVAKRVIVKTFDKE